MTYRRRLPILRPEGIPGEKRRRRKWMKHACSAMYQASFEYIRLRSKVLKNCSCSTIHNEEQENIAHFHVGPIVRTMLFNLIV